MAIEILTRGLPPMEEKYKASCNKCRTTISFLRRDANHQSDQRDGDYLWVRCPVCQATITHHLKGT